MSTRRNLGRLLCRRNPLITEQPPAGAGGCSRSLSQVIGTARRNYFFCFAMQASFFALSVIFEQSCFFSPAAKAGPATKAARTRTGTIFFSMIGILPDPESTPLEAGPVIFRHEISFWSIGNAPWREGSPWGTQNAPWDSPPDLSCVDGGRLSGVRFRLRRRDSEERIPPRWPRLP